MSATILSQIAKIRNFERGHRATQVINTGLRFGLLNALADSVEGLTPAELALKLMLHEPFLRIWCQTAYHFEILNCDEQGRFILQPYLDQVLGLDLSYPCHPEREVCAMDTPQPREEDDPLGRFVRSGRPVRLTNSPELSWGRFQATKSISTIFQSMIFPEQGGLHNRLQKGCSVLDIGCGSGQLILDFAHRYQKSSFVGIDPDFFGIDQVEQAIAELALEDRVSVLNLGGEEMDFIEKFDVALMVLTLHEILPDIRPKVLAKAFQALKKEGGLWVLDYPFPGKLEDFRNPRYEYGIVEQYFEAMGGIVHISQQKQDELLSQAGFKAIERRSVGDGGLLDFLTARK